MSSRGDMKAWFRHGLSNVMGVVCHRMSTPCWETGGRNLRAKWSPNGPFTISHSGGAGPHRKHCDDIPGIPQGITQRVISPSFFGEDFQHQAEPSARGCGQGKKQRVFLSIPMLTGRIVTPAREVGPTSLHSPTAGSPATRGGSHLTITGEGIPCNRDLCDKSTLFSSSSGSRSYVNHK